MADSSFNKAQKKVWIFAGEASGDLYGAHLAQSLQELAPDLHIAGMGGVQMKEAGVDIIVDSTELGVMGIVEVLKLYPKFKRIFNGLVARAREERPNAVVLIDYPGFNLRFAKKMKELDIPVVYYISPQIWAWKKGRAPKIAKMVEHMMVIFPFEAHLYDEFGLKTTFIGHPLVDILRDEEEVERDPNLLLLLPGSRFTEVDRIFPVMYDIAERLTENHPDLRFVIPTPREAIAIHLKEMIRTYESEGKKKLPIEITHGKNTGWMRKATAGIAASGTVTVQCAILGLPLVSMYRMNPISQWILKTLSNVKYFTMVNIISDKVIYEEFMQRQATTENILPAIERILPGGSRREEAEKLIAEAVACLGAAKPASRNAAEIVLKEMAK